MKVAVVGLGYWGPNLVRNLRATDSAPEVVACDVDEARVKSLIKQYPGAIGVTDYGEVLGDPFVDAVVLATPVSTHATLATMALDAGKSVLVEKPFATSTVEARGLIEHGEIGELLYAQSSRVNLGIHRSDVSVIWDLAPHDLSILINWLGETPVRVSATGRSSCGVGPADVAFVDLLFPSGCVANIHLSWLAPTKLRRITLVGTKRMVVYEDTQPEAPVKVYDKGVSIKDPEDFGEYRLTYRTGDVISPRIEATEPLRLELEEFLQRVAMGEVPDAREEAAISVVNTLERAQWSLESQGQPIAV